MKRNALSDCLIRLLHEIVPEKVELNGKEYIVTAIAANGFTSATKLEMVRLLKSVKTIGSNAFTNCKALKKREKILKKMKKGMKILRFY